MFLIMDNTQLEYWTCTVGEEGRKEGRKQILEMRERERERASSISLLLSPVPLSSFLQKTSHSGEKCIRRASAECVVQ